MKNLIPALALKAVRFLVVMVVFAMSTALILAAVFPDMDKAAAVLGSVLVSLLISLYDQGLFRGEFSL